MSPWSIRRPNISGRHSRNVAFLTGASVVDQTSRAEPPTHAPPPTKTMRRPTKRRPVHSCLTPRRCALPPKSPPAGPPPVPFHVHPSFSLATSIPRVPAMKSLGTTAEKPIHTRGRRAGAPSQLSAGRLLPALLGAELLIRAAPYELLLGGSARNHPSRLLPSLSAVHGCSARSAGGASRENNRLPGRLHHVPNISPALFAIGLCKGTAEDMRRRISEVTAGTRRGRAGHRGADGEGTSCKGRGRARREGR